MDESTKYLHKKNASRNEASKLWNLHFYLTLKVIMYVCPKSFPQKTRTRVHSSVSHLLKTWSSSSLQWTPALKLIQYCCALIRRADAYWNTGCQHNNRLHLYTTGYLNVSISKMSLVYRKGKIYKQRLWSKLNHFLCCTL